MKLRVSIVLEDFRSFWRSIARAGRPPKGRLGSTVTPPEDVIAAQGGRLLTLSWDPPRVQHEVCLPTPSGFVQRAEETWVGSAWTDRITRLVGDEVVGHWDHPLLNDVHAIEADGDELLIACSGSDAIVSTSGQVWRAKDPTDVVGQPIQRPDDMRGRRVPTLRRTHHLNAAVRQRGRLLATSLHRGAVVELADDAVPRLQGLNAPHGLRLDGDGLMLCEARQGRVLAVDPEFIVREDWTGLRWCQDAERAEDGRVFALDVPDLGRPDRKPSRIVELGGDSFTLPQGWRPYAVRCLP